MIKEQEDPGLDQAFEEWQHPGQRRQGAADQ
jgi:hypothetical protein